MVVENNIILECTEYELLDIYLKYGIDSIMDFYKYKEKIKDLGVRVIENKG